MKCARCQHENRLGAKFCEECAMPLARVCANCGAQLSPTAKFCSECAHPAGQAAPSTAPRFGAPEAYTPKHIAEKILTSKAALEGERKQVTVLFEDLHWIDAETQALLDSLVDSLPTTRVLLLTNYRERMSRRFSGPAAAAAERPVRRRKRCCRSSMTVVTDKAGRRRFSQGGTGCPGFPGKRQSEAGMMERRVFVTAVGMTVLAAPVRVVAQRRPGVPRVGYLFSFTPAAGRHLWEACLHRHLADSHGDVVQTLAGDAEGMEYRIACRAVAARSGKFVWPPSTSCSTIWRTLSPKDRRT
jgi:hypothetical protein